MRRSRQWRGRGCSRGGCWRTTAGWKWMRWRVRPACAPPATPVPVRATRRTGRSCWARLAGVRGKARSGRFRCAMALAQAGVVRGAFEGAVEGVIVNAERGEGGFGYDALFIPEGHCETLRPASRRDQERPQPPRPRARAGGRLSRAALSYMSKCCTVVSRSTSRSDFTSPLGKRINWPSPCMSPRSMNHGWRGNL